MAVFFQQHVAATLQQQEQQLSVSLQQQEQQLAVSLQQQEQQLSIFLQQQEKQLVVSSAALRRPLLSPFATLLGAPGLVCYTVGAPATFCWLRAFKGPQRPSSPWGPLLH